MGINVTVEAPWQDVLLTVLRVMHREGLAARRRFDLQGARRSLPYATKVRCPYHETTECSCQYLVLVVTASAGPSATVILQGSDRSTTVTLLPPSDGEDKGRLSAVVLDALEGLTTGPAADHAAWTAGRSLRLLQAARSEPGSLAGKSACAEKRQTALPRDKTAG